jgi:hypothetical protein
MIRPIDSAATKNQRGVIETTRKIKRICRRALKNLFIGVF